MEPRTILILFLVLFGLQSLWEQLLLLFNLRRSRSSRSSPSALALEIWGAQDYGRASDLGDLNRQPLAEVWRGARRREALEMLYGQREAADGFLCSRCELAVPHGEQCACDPDVPPEKTWSGV